MVNEGGTPEKVLGKSEIVKQTYGTPHALFVDCVYVVAKRTGVKITSRGIASKTKTALGIGTQPRPREWTTQFDFLIDKVLG